MDGAHDDRAGNDTPLHTHSTNDERKMNARAVRVTQLGGAFVSEEKVLMKLDAALGSSSHRAPYLLLHARQPGSAHTSKAS